MRLGCGVNGGCSLGVGSLGASGAGGSTSTGTADGFCNAPIPTSTDTGGSPPPDPTGTCVPVGAVGASCAIDSACATGYCDHGACGDHASLALPSTCAGTDIDDVLAPWLGEIFVDD